MFKCSSEGEKIISKDDLYSGQDIIIARELPNKDRYKVGYGYIEDSDPEYGEIQFVLYSEGNESVVLDGQDIVDIDRAKSDDKNKGEKFGENCVISTILSRDIVMWNFYRRKKVKKKNKKTSLLDENTNRV